MNEFSADPFAEPSDGTPNLARGRDLKAKGQYDLALTEFRRAVLANPKLCDAWMEIGALCRQKSKSDEMFLRYAFEAYQKAARLDLTEQAAHDNYITTAQLMGRMEELNEEYRQLSKQHPDNQLLQRCFKNTSTLLLAMIPDKVNFAQTENTKKIRQAIFIASVGLILVGCGSALMPIILIKALKIKMTAAMMKQIMVGGIMMIGLGVAGILLKTKVS